MRKATITQLKNELSDLLELAKNGEPVLIFDRNIPIVQLISARSFEAGSESENARVLQLERSGMLRRGDCGNLTKLLNTQKPVKLKNKINVVNVLLEEKD